MKEIDVEILFEIAGSETVALEKELHEFSSRLQSDLDLKFFLNDSGVAEIKKIELFEALYPAASKTFRELYVLMVKEGMLERLYWLANKYSEVVSAKTGTQLVEVTSASLIDEQSALKLKEPKTRYRFTVNPAVLGGLKLKWEDGRYFDATLQGEIEALKEALLV